MLFLRWYLWVVPNVLSLLCALILARRKQWKAFPAFTLYLVLQVLEFVGLMAADLLIVGSVFSLPTFRWMLVILESVEAVVQLFVIYELAKHLLLSRPSSAKILSSSSRIIFAALLLFTAGFAAVLPQNGLDRVMAVFQILDFAASLVTMGSIIALLLCTRALSISWRSMPAGIALGFGIITAAELISSPLLPAMAVHQFIPTDFFRMGADHVAVLVWLVYILLPEPASRYSGAGIAKSEFEGWQQQLQGLLRK